MGRLLTLGLDLLLLQLDCLDTVLYISKSLFGTCLFSLGSLFKHNDLELHLSLFILQLASFRLECGQLSLIFFHHLLLNSLVLLVEFKRMLLVDSERLQSGTDLTCNCNHILRIKEVVLQ